MSEEEFESRKTWYCELGTRGLYCQNPEYRLPNERMYSRKPSETLKQTSEKLSGWVGDVVKDAVLADRESTSDIQQWYEDNHHQIFRLANESLWGQSDEKDRVSEGTGLFQFHV